MNEEKKKLLLDAMQRLDELETQLQVMESKNKNETSENLKVESNIIYQPSYKSSPEVTPGSQNNIVDLYNTLIDELLVKVEQSEDETKIALLVKCVEQLNEHIEKLRNVL